MVRLAFNKKKDAPESKTTKKNCISLNPFADFVEESIIPEEPENVPFLSCKSNYGLEKCHLVLNDWYYNKWTKPLLIIGPTGCGKTTLIESFCKEENIDVYRVRLTDLVKTKNDLIKDICLFLNNSNIFSFFSDRKSSKKLIFIDEYQNNNDLLTTSDIINFGLANTNRSELTKTVQKELTKLLGNAKMCPVLIISGDAKGSKLSELKKAITVYNIGELSKSDMKKVSSDVELVEICGSDKRMLNNILNFGSIKGKKITKKEQFVKDIDIDLFDFVNKIFDSTEITTIDEVFKAYESDGYLISNLIHENYLDFSDSIDSIAKSADSISLGENMMCNTYESSKSFIANSHCLDALYYPSYYAKSTFKNNKCQLRTPMINNRYNIYLNNKEYINDINKNEVNIIGIEEILFYKSFLTYSLVKSKTITPLQEDYLSGIINNFTSDKQLKLELIYKHFSEFKDNIKEPKTKLFTLKFKEKIKKVLI